MDMNGIIHAQAALFPENENSVPGGSASASVDHSLILGAAENRIVLSVR
jgi:hypothetical protein